MRIVLLLVVAAAIAVAATQLLKTSVPVAAPHSGQPAAVPASREALQKFGQDVQGLTNDAAAERARRAEEATR